MNEPERLRRSRIRFGVLVAGTLAIGVAGYVGFFAFVESAPGIAAGVMILAAGTGFAAFFSPCSFPLLLTLLARGSAETGRTALASAVRIGAGATLFFALVATVLALGGSALEGIIGFDTTAGRFFRLMVGLLLIVFGLRQAGSVRLGMRWLDRVAAAAGQVLDPSRHENRARSDVVYGFGYVLVGFG